MDCNKSFSYNYMLLKPKDIGFVDLLRMLFSNSYYLQHHKKFVECPEEEETNLQNILVRRWIMFISIVVQKILMFVSTPMAWVGSFIENWINLVSCNYGFGMLLLNATRGKVVRPNKESPNFLSFVGNLDRRVELDGNIKPGDERYLAQLAMMASKASYENKSYHRATVTDHGKFLGSYDFWNDYQQKLRTQGFMMRDNNTNVIMVAFRGTEPFNTHNWCSNFDLSWYELPGMGKLHDGFMKALGLQKNHGRPKEIKQTHHHNYHNNRAPVAYYTIRDKLRKMLGEDEGARYIIMGHSLGGAVAVLFPAILALHGETMLLDNLKGVYTFGQPRVGDVEFGKFMEKYMKEHRIRYFRFVYSNDMVARLPYNNSTFMFKHFGTCYYYDISYLRKILPEEPNLNYFSPKNAILMIGNMVYELIRSITIPLKQGPDYKESAIMRIIRVMDVFLSGAPAHSPMDYNSMIRLGSDAINPSIYGSITIEKDS